MTELVFSAVDILDGTDLHVCRYVSRLSSLQKLILAFDYDRWPPFARGDALQLSTLTELTRLDFGRGGWYDEVGDAAAAAIACELTNLCYLSMIRCGIQGTYLLPIISKLSGLQVLMLRGNNFVNVMNGSDLMLLSRLPNLRCLDKAEDDTF